MSSPDLRARLLRLGLRPLSTLPPRPAPAIPAAPSRIFSAESAQLPGVPYLTPHGEFQLIEQRYPAAHAQGALTLGAFLAAGPATVAAQMAHDAALAQTDLRGLAFVDTETSGLAGGVGTFAFLVGVGWWEAETFVLRQYFLRDPHEEQALLHQLVADLAPRVGWVTFNGKSFDLPLLETRLTLHRQRGALGRKPHLDLLTPARRLYRGRLPSCGLGELERQVLRLPRTQVDVSGTLIPQMYLDYLHTGDAAEMQRVLYHNAMDILSMVTLAAHLLTIFSAAPSAPAAHLLPPDWLRLALWHDDGARPTAAEAAYTHALAQALPLEDRRLGLARYAALLKRLDRRAEAVPLWEQLAAFTLDDPEPFVELAKYHEWHTKNWPAAQQWTNRARAVVESWPKNWQREAALTELQQRLTRLQTKLAARPSETPGA